VRACAAALRLGGVLAVWSAGPDELYLERLERAGLSAREEGVPARGAGGGVRHVVVVASKPKTTPRPGEGGNDRGSRPRGLHSRLARRAR
jgi:hypothetical protein